MAKKAPATASSTGLEPPFLARAPEGLRPPFGGTPPPAPALRACRSVAPLPRAARRSDAARALRFHAPLGVFEFGPQPRVVFETLRLLLRMGVAGVGRSARGRLVLGQGRPWLTWRGLVQRLRHAQRHGHRRSRAHAAHAVLHLPAALVDPGGRLLGAGGQFWRGGARRPACNGGSVRSSVPRRCRESCAAFRAPHPASAPGLPRSSPSVQTPHPMRAGTSGSGHNARTTRRRLAVTQRAAVAAAFNGKRDGLGHDACNCWLRAAEDAGCLAVRCALHPAVPQPSGPPRFR